MCNEVPVFKDKDIALKGNNKGNKEVPYQENVPVEKTEGKQRF